MTEIFKKTYSYLKNRKKREKMREKNLFLLFSLLILIIVMPFISGNILDWITGRATQPTNVSITISAVQLNWTSTISDQNITENGINYTTFYFTAAIPGGDVTDLNDSSARANFTRAGESTRENLTCSWVEDIGADTANYSCTIGKWYWDGAGDWNITAAVADINENWGVNDSTTFTLLETTAFAASPNALTWPTIKAGDTNSVSNNDPSLLNNTANKDIAIGDINISALDLHGETDDTYYIDSVNFTTDIDTGAEAECDGDILSNNTYVSITSAILTAGNNSLNYGNETSGQEQLYYCLVEANNSLIAQAYSTDLLGSWTIQIT